MHEVIDPQGLVGVCNANQCESGRMLGGSRLFVMPSRRLAISSMLHSDGRFSVLLTLTANHYSLLVHMLSGEAKTNLCVALDFTEYFCTPVPRHRLLIPLLAAAEINFPPNPRYILRSHRACPRVEGLHAAFLLFRCLDC